MYSMRFNSFSHHRQMAACNRFRLSVKRMNIIPIFDVTVNGIVRQEKAEMKEHLSLPLATLVGPGEMCDGDDEETIVSRLAIVLS
jgi:hypothetical protein